MLQQVSKVVSPSRPAPCPETDPEATALRKCCHERKPEGFSCLPRFGGASGLAGYDSLAKTLSSDHLVNTANV